MVVKIYSKVNVKHLRHNERPINISCCSWCYYHMSIYLGLWTTDFGLSVPQACLKYSSLWFSGEMECEVAVLQKEVPTFMSTPLKDRGSQVGQGLNWR